MNAAEILKHREQRELSVMEEKMLAQSWQAFSSSMAGRDFLAKLQDVENQALKAIQDCADYRESTELLIRYQQRRGICNVLRSYLAGQLELLGGEENEHDPDDPGADNSSYS